MKIEEVIKQLESILAHVCSMAAEADADGIWKEDIAALEFTLAALRSMPEAGEPLSLEQLKQMDGKPVWIVEFPDWGHWELSEDAEDYLCDRDTDLYGFMSDLDGEAGYHELGWLAYPYPPAHIDRSKWEPCGNCKKACWNCKHNLFCCEGNDEECDDCVNQSKWEWGGYQRYCSKCGRPLTEEVWAELERRVRG